MDEKQIRAKIAKLEGGAAMAADREDWERHDKLM